MNHTFISTEWCFRLSRELFREQGEAMRRFMGWSVADVKAQAEAFEAAIDRGVVDLRDDSGLMHTED